MKKIVQWGWAMWMVELRHLRTLQALRAQGSLAGAAEQLHLTASALSHQLRELEHGLGLPVVNRKTRPLGFAPAGMRLLALADQVLPQVHSAQRELARLAQGQAGRLLLASECHSCFDWLMPILNQYRQEWPEVELDFASGFEAEVHAQLLGGELDVLITSDRLHQDQLQYWPLFEYESRLVLPVGHALATAPSMDAADIAACTLIAYPVALERLDVMLGCLLPRQLQPVQVRTTELTPMLIQLVASGRGVAALPDWVVAPYEQKGWVVSRSLPVVTGGQPGLYRTLYAAARPDAGLPAYVQGFIAALQQGVRLSR